MNHSQTHTFWWYLTPAPGPLQSYPEHCWPAPAIAQLSLASIRLSASAVLKPGLAWPASHSQADPSDWLQVISNICNKNYIQHLVMFTNLYRELCDSYFLLASNFLLRSFQKKESRSKEDFMIRISLPGIINLSPNLQSCGWPKRIWGLPAKLIMDTPCNTLSSVANERIGSYSCWPMKS